MTLQVFRFGVDVTHGEPLTVAQDEDRLHLKGSLTTEATNASIMNAFRQNVLGLGEKDTDEPIGPVIDTADDQLKGFYRVLGTSVDFPGGAFSKNRFTWNMDLERIPDYALPDIQAPLVGGFRTNSHSINPTPNHWVPSTVLNYANSANTGLTDWQYSRGLADGTTVKGAAASGSKSSASRYLAQFALQPDYYYTGSPRVEIKYATSTYYRTMGRKIWSNLSSVGWRLTNDLIRVTPSSTAGRLDISIWDGSAWDTAKTFKFTTTDTGSIVDRFSSFNIIRNAPEEVIVRVGLGDNITGTAASLSRLYLDISLKRGWAMADCVWNSDRSILGVVGVNTVEAATAVTGGIRATSNDAAGNRYAMFTPVAKTNDLVNGTITLSTPGTQWAFGLGLIQNGSGATSSFDATALSNDYFGVYSESQTIVGR